MGFGARAMRIANNYAQNARQTTVADRLTPSYVSRRIENPWAIILLNPSKSTKSRSDTDNKKAGRTMSITHNQPRNMVSEWSNQENRTMKNLRILIVMMSILLTLLACRVTGGVPAPTSAPTQLPPTLSQPTQAPAPAPTQVPPTPSQPTSAPAPTASNGKPISIGGISFVLADQVASDISSNTTTELELPYINGPADLPQHTVLTLNNYHVQGTREKPQIIVFRAAEYAQYDDLAAKTLTALQSPYVDGQPLPQPLDCGICAQIHGLTFRNGHGIRLLEQVNTGPMPFNNENLFYYFRGITDDGQFYIQVELPIQAPFLPANDNLDTPLPAEGVPFNMNDISGYKTAIRQEFNAAAPGVFTPTIDQLDALLESLQVTGL
jgi:hypothetical protein